ncbi:MAG: 3-deoxy-7-phosphoheptulonate synthase class II [Verrucomicrobia subdivision 3 bacterium]|nr:3-deoxy-7-phosphoheptulonate synthase class II [Limisphaerales bacterium]
MNHTATHWTPASWRAQPIQQQPPWPNAGALQAALDEVRALPPLVNHGEVDALRAHLAEAARGKAFLLQGGDCAERFADCTKSAIEAKLKILLQMSLVLTWGARIPIIRVGRMAGQFAKPRSSDTETVDGIEMPSYRGDNVNAITPDLAARRPDPKRLVKAYHLSAATLNYARALVDGGFADLHHPQHWDLGFVRSQSHRAEYEDMVERIRDAIDFLESTGVRGTGALRTVELFSSHEGLLLDYEEALTEKVGDRHYNLGAHFLWIGDRTRNLGDAHLEYFRGIENPIGIKVGKQMQPNELVEIINAVEPANRPGRITLISRIGAADVREALPPLIAAVREAGQKVAWSCDPMHGNTTTTESGLKTRDYDCILAELEAAFELHAADGGQLAGVHFELTGEDVTECTGGPQELSEADLSRSYETYCDPRLNYAQSLELALRIAQRLQSRRTAGTATPNR